MKVNKINWEKPLVFVMLATGLLFYSCNNKKDSETSGTDTSALNNNTTDTSTATTRKGRAGKVSIAPAAVNTTEKMSADKTGYYNYAEVAPSYSGGQGAIESYITNNIQYPEEAIGNNIEGTVNIQLGIDESGNVSNVTAIGNKIGYGLEEEAIKVISNMPKWTPGTVKGKNVKTWMILPITYRFEE